MTFWYREEHLAFLREHRTLTRPELADRFNERFGADRTPGQLRSLCKRKGILTGRNGRFKPGDIPWTAGRTGFNPGKATNFKKGNKPHNSCPVGTERLTSVDKYIKVKIAEPNKWQFKHLLVWREHHGDVPAGHSVIFLDNDRSNVTIENLRLVSRSELLFLNRNGFADAPAEVRPTALAIAKVAVRVFEEERA